MIDLKKIQPDIRYLKNMERVVYDKEWFKKAPEDLELYYMYREVEKKDGMRYDITIIPARMLGQEWVKTKGHQHACEETYNVLEGEAIFLLQKTKGKIVEDVYVVEAKKGDAVIVPPNYDHIAINPCNQELKIGNWMPEDCENIYDLFEEMKGACYFYIKDPSTKLGVNWLKNENYKKVPKLRAGGEIGRHASFRS